MTSLVIFGASGDLTKRKLLPALENLGKQGLLPKELELIGCSRTASPPPLRSVTGDFTRDDAMKRLASELRGRDVLFYLAVGPRLFAPIVEAAARAGLLSEKDGWRRVVVEKPFGRDLASAKELNRRLLAVLDERQIYRIDHYLGKETVQNLLVLRFANGVFEPLWDRRYVDHVQITVAEELGVEKRGAYYDGSGALRDMVPNHIFQLLTFAAMEPPASFGADALRAEQLKVLRALAPEMTLVRGQYAGYTKEPNVRPDSRTETFAAMRVHVDNWRWNGVPWVFRTGKRLPCRSTEIVVQFKRAPHAIFRGQCGRPEPNQLVIRVQPREGVALRLQAKEPGTAIRAAPVDLDFTYEQKLSGGYERLLHDALLGDQTLFKSAEMIEAAWAFLEPALKETSLHVYEPGTWGPKEADELLGAGWRSWRACAR